MTIPFDRVNSFLVNDALPFWSTEGAYANGCFVERLDLATGAPVDPGFTRVRVQARQLYVFSHAEWAGAFRKTGLTDRAFQFFVRSAWQGPDLGWAKLIDRHGNVLDGSSDLYDIAFALFALGWRYKASRDPVCLTLAHQTLDHLDRNMKHPLGGYNNDSGGSLPRQQNPHMHLVEALAVWSAASHEPRFAQIGAHLLDLLESRFWDAVTGSLGEYFEEDWTACPPPLGNIVEPGHQFEWAWIMGQWGRATGRPRLEMMQRLIQFALRYGFDATTGLTIDKIGRAGVALDRSHRLWPQTEALKAALAASEFLGEKDVGRIEKIVDTIFSRFLSPAPVRGAWIDHFDATGRPIANGIPATSLYHVTLAFFELLRLRSHLDSIEKV